MKLFTTRIFFGSPVAAQQIKELTRQIERLQEIDSGLQQPCHCDCVAGRKACACKERTMAQERKALAKSIRCALGV